MLRPLKVIFAGAPDNGKSTLIGALLTYCGNIKVDEQQKDLAFYTDGLESERQNRSTIDVCYRTLITPQQFRVMMVDTPGQHEYMRHFISGASGADLLINVLDGTRPHSVSRHVEWVTLNLKIDVLNVVTKAYTHPHYLAIDSYTGHGIPYLIELLEHQASNNVWKTHEHTHTIT